MKSKIAKVVRDLVLKYGTNDPFELADALDILIMPSAAVNGCTITLMNCPVILLGQHLSSHEKRYVCAHELGHNVLHDIKRHGILMNCTFFSTEKLEIEADTFAAELLVPDDIWLLYPEYTIKQIAAVECVPVELLKMKVNLA